MRALAAILVIVIASAISVFAQAEPDRHGVLIDKKPLRDFSTAALRKIDSGEVDPKAPFRVEFEAALDKSGKYDSAKSSFILAEGTEATVALVKDAITAVAKSGVLGYAIQMERPVDGKLLISVSQTNDTFAAAIKSKASTTERAKVVVAALSNFLTIGLMNAEERDALIVRNIRVGSEAADWTITLSLTGAELDKAILSRLGSGK